MQVSIWITFFIVVAIAIFAVQNSNAAPVTIKFLFWGFETSLVYTILGSIGLGILVTLVFWIPRAIRGYLRERKTSGTSSPGRDPSTL